MDVFLFVALDGRRLEYSSVDPDERCFELISFRLTLLDSGVLLKSIGIPLYRGQFQSSKIIWSSDCYKYMETTLDLLGGSRSGRYHRRCHLRLYTRIPFAANPTAFVSKKVKQDWHATRYERFIQ
ncbi:hypothetical protein NPIL_562411 [Nephila pilipes]|uniref:Uncharacterized protein n=1 Tax=Nephila pilipes TaxID=299642 RepID=A0A8X6NI79_NEPPI|nr:hypothetical protein NPIL_562411 [Nephila pilipes]